MFGSLFRYKYKTLLILISAVSAIASIFLITALANGIIQMYATMLKTDGDIIVMQKGVADTFFSDVNRSILPMIEKIEGVKSAQGVLVAAGSIGEEVPIAGIYGVTPNRLENYRLTYGRYPQKPYEVILGENIDLMLDSPKEVTLMGKKFRVVGAFKSDIGFENGGVVIDIADAEKIFHKNASFLLVSLGSIEQGTQEVIKEIGLLSDDIDVRSTKAFIENYNQFKIIRISSGVIAFISFFMGFLAIVSLMSIMINDRRFEFGIKRAVGIPQKRIVFEIAVEVVSLILVAFFIAFALSFFLLEMLQHIERFQGYLSGEIDLSLFLQLLAGSVMMGLLGALIPAWMASRVDPVILINRGQ